MLYYSKKNKMLNYLRLCDFVLLLPLSIETVKRVVVNLLLLTADVVRAARTVFISDG